MSPSRLARGGEFDLIRRLTVDWTDGLAEVAGVAEGPGDDAAVLDGGWVVSTDLAIEGVHFRRDWLEADEIGARAAAAALSDLAAMAAEPVAILLSLAGSRDDLDTGVLEVVGRGAREAGRAVGAALIGGDLSRSSGPLVIDVVALGRTSAPVLRRGAKIGDALYLTGRLGGSAAALEYLQRGDRPPDELFRKFARPRPRILEARFLASRGALHALIDVSDGLAGDVRHLAAASGVGIDIEVDAVPIDGWARAGGSTEARRRAFTGGEDYELLFAAPRSIEGTLEAFAAAFPGLPVTKVGQVVAGGEVRFLNNDGAPIHLGTGWDHFASPAFDGVP
jgi:thiamine-monophosphate kinase